MKTMLTYIKRQISVSKPVLMLAEHGVARTTGRLSDENVKYLLADANKYQLNNCCFTLCIKYRIDISIMNREGVETPS